MSKPNIQDQVTRPGGTFLLKNILGLGRGATGDLTGAVEYSAPGQDPFGEREKQRELMKSGGAIAGTDPLSGYAKNAATFGAFNSGASYDKAMGGSQAYLSNSLNHGYGGKNWDGSAIGALQSNTYRGVEGANQQARAGLLGADGAINASRGVLRDGAGATAGDISPYYRDANNAGAAGTAAIAGMTNQHEQALLSGIDAAAEQGISGALTGVQGQMEASGLSRSGGASNAAGSLISGIMSDANRQKIAALSGFREASMGRNADAINQQSAMAGQAALAGMGEVGSSGRQYQGFEQDLYGAQTGAQNDIYMSDAERRSTLGLGMEDAQFQKQYGEDEAHRAAAQQLGGMYDTRLAQQQLAMDRMDQQGIRQQQLEQMRRNQELEAFGMPYEDLMGLSTGMASEGIGQYGNVNPFSSAAAQLGGNVVGGMLQPSSAIR